ncbi:MAG: LapA family protein [Rugosibacter sp.]|nr:LapA family protein [Rugosibacter sp.]
MMSTLFRFFLWVFRAFLFFALLGLAIKNSGTMLLRFFFNQEWTAPVSLVILTVFALGVAVGLTAAISFSRRRKPKVNA